MYRFTCLRSYMTRAQQTAQVTQVTLLSVTIWKVIKEQNCGRLTKYFYSVSGEKFVGFL